VLRDQPRDPQLAATLAPAARDFQHRDLAGDVAERDCAPPSCGLQITAAHPVGARPDKDFGLAIVSGAQE
jgi:hypothetical protein